MVIGHVTMWPLTLAEQTNIMLDVAADARPSGADAELSRRHPERHGLVSERPGRGADRNHHPSRVRSMCRARRWRIARARRFSTATRVDKVVEQLSTKNNGLYTNEWMIGDARTNEIAMLELGTYRTKLYRSSKNEWFGGTEGFYWGCNNAKDLNVRLEYVPDPHGAPEDLPFVPAIARCEVAGDVSAVQRQDRRDIRIPGVPHRAAGERQHHGRESHHVRDGVAHDDVGAVRKAESARVGAVADGEGELSG